MKTIKALFLLCVALCFASSCKKEDDMTLIQKTILENTDIRQIEVSNAWEVTIVADDHTYVELSYSAYLEPYLKATMESTKLKIGFSQNIHHAINSVYRAKIHTNKIERIEVKKGAQMNFVGHFSSTSDVLSIDLNDASTCSGLDYSGHVCNISIEGASHFLDFQISGYKCEVKVSDASTCKGSFDMSWQFFAELSNASQLVTFGGASPYSMIKLQDASLLNMVQSNMREMYVNLSGASEATVQVTELMEGMLTEASTLYYKGNPEINIDCSDDSQLIPF